MTLSTRTRATIYTTVFLACVSFAIVMPSLWPYLDGLGASKSFLALVVSFYSVGEGVGALIFGWLSARYRTRYVMTWATAVGAMGSALYAFAELFPERSHGAWMVFFGRFAQGIWTGGAQAAQQTHLSQTLSVDELTPATVNIGAFAVLGFVVGPSFALAFEYAPSFCLLEKLCANQLTLPGYFVWLSALVTILLYAYCFDDDDDDALRLLRASAHTSCDANGSSTFPTTTLVDEMQSVKMPTKLTLFKPTESTRLLEPGDEGNLKLAIFICNLTYFVHFYGFAVQETITTPLVQTYYGWSVHSANLLFTAAGACSLLVFVFVQKFSGVVDDKTFTYISLLIGAGGFALLPSRLSHPVGKVQFLVAFGLITVAFPLGRATVMSLFTKVTPMRLQGTAQGAILAVGAIARIIGPFIAVVVFWYELGGWLVFGASAALFVATAVLFRLSYAHLWTRLEPNEVVASQEIAI